MSIAAICTSSKFFNKFANLCRLVFIKSSAHDGSLQRFDSVKKSYAASCCLSIATTDMAPPTVSNPTITTMPAPPPPVTIVNAAAPVIKATCPVISSPRFRFCALSEFGNSQISSSGFHFTFLHSGHDCKLAFANALHCS